MRTLLHQIITQRNWQYPTFRGRFEKAARELAEIEGAPHLATLAPSERTYERWYLGETKPVPDARRILVHLFDRPVDELLAPPGPHALPVTAHAQRTPPDENFALGAASGAPNSTTTYEMGRQAAMAANRALRFAVIAESTSVGAETLDHIRDEVTRIAAAYPRVALHDILADLIEIQDLVFRLLESDRPTPAQAVDLHLWASMTSGMLAKASHDLSDPKSAMTQARAAYVCADQAGHNGMRAWIRGLQSLIAYWSGRPDDAATYAARGATLLTAPAGTVAVWLAAQEARAHAVLGDADGVHTALLQATDARDATVRDDLDAIGGILTFPRPRQAYYTAEARVLLGDTTRNTERAAEEAVHAYATAPADEWAFGDQAGAHTNLALARIARSDLDGAADAVGPVLDLPPAQHNHGIIVSAQRVREALSTGPLRNAAQTKDLRAELEAFTATPTPALPR
ncbi:hypothetical protein ACX6XY_15285 [Streptomyces sp. O3]